MCKHATLVVAASLAVGCLSGGSPLEGLAPSNPNDMGPTIVWDMFAEPLPEIPLPNDVGTRPDLGSATGRRVNISQHAKTQHERDLRMLMDELEGFSTYAPISLSFDGRVDLEEILRRHRNDDPSDDAIYVVNMNPASKNYGQPMLLDLDDGRFPLVVENTDNYFLNDPRGQASNLVFETVAEEDENGNGILDPAEDTDDDGIWDHPNTWGTFADDPSRDDPVDDLITFYELETDTLLIRTVFPREELSTYAVILTRNLVGKETGSPIRSPFGAINHTQQTSVLRPLLEDHILSGIGIELEDIAFTWTFTTQSNTGDIEALRAGLYGIGTFSRLASEFPARVSFVPVIEPPETTENPYILTTERLLDALGDDEFLGAVGLDPDTAGPTLDAYADYVAYFSLFRVESPALLDNDLEVFRINRHTGDGDWGRETLYVTCAVPRERAGFQQPFPVMFYSHGYTSSRFELLGFAGQLARYGIATCAVDAFGHGLPSSDFIIGLVKELLKEKGLELFAAEVFASRARDLNADDATDSGGDFWSANLLHTRDVVRQTQLDYMQVIRVLRQFGSATMPVDIDGDGQPDVAGDFNADGVADVGGEVPYFMFGQSLGGIMSALVAPMEPAVVASVPGSAGGGLGHLGTRTRQGGVVQAFFLPVMGPLIVGRPGSQNRIELMFDILDINDEEEIRFARVPDPVAGLMDELEVGDRIRVTNLDNGEIDEVVLREPAPGRPVGEFRLQFASDVLDRVRVDLMRAGSATPYRTIDTFETPDLEEVGFNGVNYRVGDTLVSLQEGFGHRRNTPDFRRMLLLGQMALDPADPISFARLHSEPVAVRPEGAVPTNVLVINTVGDMNVPVDTGIAIGRAAGLIGVRQIDPRYGKSQDQVLIDNHVIEGLERLDRFDGDDPCHYDPRQVLFDVDDTSEGLDPQQGPRLTFVNLAPQCDGSPGEPEECARCAPMPPLRATREYDWGVSGMRIPYVSRTGKHGFETPDPNALFDYNLFCINQVAWYFATGGTQIADDVCLATSSCDFLPQ